MVASRELEVGCSVAKGAGSFETAVEAAEKAVSFIEAQPVCVALVFASVKYDLDEVLRGVRSVVGDVPVIGATTAGEICGGRHDQSVAVTVWASRHIVVRAAVGRSVSSDWRRSVAEVSANPAVREFFCSSSDLWSRLTREGKSVFAMLFTPGQSKDHDSRGPEILEALKIATQSKFPIFAAAAADDWKMERNFVLFGERSFSDSLLLAVFETRLQFGIALAHGFEPSASVASVTAVDDREVLAIDGLPAVEELPKLLGSTRAAVGQGHLSLATRRVVGALNGLGQYRVMAATYLTENGGCRFAQPVTPGTVLTAMECNPESMRLSTSEAVRKAILRGGITKPALAMIGYCALRERFVGSESAREEIALTRKLMGKAPLFGFCCFGEGGVSDDGVSRYNNATVVALVLGRDLAPGAQVALEAENFRREIERRANGLEKKVVQRTAALRRAVANLSESEERFRLAMHGANDGLWDCNLRTNKVYLSPRWKSMLGYGEHELRDRLDSWRLLVHPEDKSAAMGKLRRVLLGEESFETEYRMLHKNGHYVDILSRAFPVIDENGKVVRLVGTHVDISERKRVERSLRQAAAVFTSTHEGVVVTDINARIVAVNPAFRSITGYSDDELLGAPIAILKSGRQGQDFYRNMWRSMEDKGFWQGEIWNRRKNGEIYPEWLTISAIRDDGGRLVNYVGVFADISLIKKSEERLQYIAHHDSLTDLPNRVLLLSRLQQTIANAERDNRAGAVMFLDLDQFKYVNDSLGHAAGDELLKQVAHRIRSNLREGDMLARLGGDEFVIVLEKISAPEEAAEFATMLIHFLSHAPFFAPGGKEVAVGASIGIALFPADGRCPNDILRHADAALYKAKNDGRAGYCFYSSELTEAAAARLEMERHFRRALEQNEFELYYQPLVSGIDGRIRSVEALVRWRDPEKGVILPDAFIPFAEETGLIVPLGDWVLCKACTQMAEWLARGAQLEAIAVNLSPRQFHQYDILERVRRILDETGLPGRCLELEITESALLLENGAISLKMAGLKALGVRFSIDDFGTGYSSFAYLKQFPISQLKIDKTFTQNLGSDSTNAQIFSAIVAVARAFELQVVAEGVETPAQLQAVKDHGCDLIQGYLFSKPLPEREFSSILRLIDDSTERPRAAAG
jgi:diguanylate cyclase (GGDEF)-like protein/PAS domain S-box-containing protein